MSAGNSIRLFRLSAKAQRLTFAGSSTPRSSRCGRLHLRPEAGGMRKTVIFGSLILVPLLLGAFFFLYDTGVGNVASSARPTRELAEPRKPDIETPTEDTLFPQHPAPALPPLEASIASEPPAEPGSELRKIKSNEKVLKELPEGKIVLDAPTRMKVGDIRAVYANVGINVPIEVLRKHTHASDQSIEASLKVAHAMTAVLTGPGFQIAATTPEKQSVAEGFPTVWSWDIEAKQEGEQELEATLYVLLPSVDKSTQQRIDSFSQKIGVTVKEQTWADWLRSSKDEIEAVKVIVVTLGGAVISVFGWIGWSYSRRRKIEEKQTSASTS
jgi:hypothetical protein